MKKLVYRFGSVFASLALLITVANVNTSCFFMAHQPELPKGAQKLKKVNR